RKNELPEKLIWLTPAEAQRALNPGKLTALKLRLARISATTWKWFMGGKTQIMVESRLLTFYRGSPALTNVGTHEFTTALGMRAWIISPEEWKALKKQLSGYKDVTAVQIGITTIAGLQTMASSGTGP